MQMNIYIYIIFISKWNYHERLDVRETKSKRQERKWHNNTVIKKPLFLTESSKSE